MTLFCDTSERISRCQPHLGTFVRVLAAPETRAELVDAAFAQITSVDRLMSPKAPGLDIVRVLRAAIGEEIELAPLTAEVIRLAQKISALSGGTFDVAKSKSSESRAVISWLSENWIRVEEPGLLDLGGIAKGYAVDRALAVLREGGAEWALVDAGGDAAAFGRAQTFSVRHPTRDGEMIGALEFSDCALATSSPQFTVQTVQGDFQHHLFNARTQQFGPVGRSASVIAPTCAVADALTKAVYFDGDAAVSALRALGAQGWWWDEKTGWHAVT